MARRRTPKLVGVRKKPKMVPPENNKTEQEVYAPRVKTEREKVYDIIYDACCWGYRFTDSYFGIPFIELDDVEEKEEDIYVIRFRCEPKYMHEVYFLAMAKDVCRRLNSGLHAYYSQQKMWGIPYEECAWVLQKDELIRHEPIWKGLFMNATVSEELKKPCPKKCSHERWEDFLQTHYHRSLLSVAQELGYSEQNLDLLGCNPADKEQKKAIYIKHKHLFDSFLHDEWNRALVDGRNVLDYFKDLIASWIGEDLLVRALNEYGFTASLANADSDRVIKTNRVSVTGEPDIKIVYEGNTRYLELMDALSPVEKYGQFDLRLSKAKNQFNRKTIFLLHGLADNKFVLIDFMRDNVTVTYNYPNPRFGNKSCSIVKLEDNGVKMQNMALLWETIRDIMLNTNPETPHCMKMVDYETGNIEVLGSDDSDDDSKSLDGDESDSEDASFAEESSDEASEETAEDAKREVYPPVAQQHEHQTDTIDIPAQTADVHSQDIVDEQSMAQQEEYPPKEDTEGIEGEDSFVAEDEHGNAVEYSAEQWDALNDVF